MNTLHPLPIRIWHKQQATSSSLDCRFLLCVAVAVVAAAITTRVRFAVDKLGEVDDEVLVLARSKRKVENTLDVHRFYEHLYECAKQCRYIR